MSMIRFSAQVEELDCAASLNVDLDKQPPAFWEQYDTRGEAIAQAVVDVAKKLAEQLRQEYDQRDVINDHIKELGRVGGGT